MPRHPTRPISARLMRLSLALVAVTLLAVCGCDLGSDLDLIVCSSHRDCTSEALCRDRRCVPLSATENLCDSDVDCPALAECLKGVCRAVDEKALVDGDRDADVVVEQDRIAGDADTESAMDDEGEATPDEPDEPVVVEQPETAVEVEITACDDGSICTEDVLRDGACIFYAANDGASCDDDNPFTENDVCRRGICIGSFINSDTCCGEDCDNCHNLYVPDGYYNCDGAACAMRCNDGFRLSAGVCVAFSCDDGNACTGDAITDDGAGCIHIPMVENSICVITEGRCMYTGLCRTNVCFGATMTSCNDGVDCTVDSCDAKTGCAYTPDNSRCESGYVCNARQGCVAER